MAFRPDDENSADWRVRAGANVGDDTRSGQTWTRPSPWSKGWADATVTPGGGEEEEQKDRKHERTRLPSRELRRARHEALS